HAVLGRREDARQEYQRAADAYRSVPTRDVYSLYNEACVHARLSALTPSGAPDEVARHAETAVRTLARSVAAGLRNPSVIRGDSAFAPLRGRADSQMLLLAAAFPDAPFGP